MVLIKYHQAFDRCGDSPICEMDFELTKEEQKIYDQEIKRIKQEILKENPDLRENELELTDDDLEMLGEVPELSKALERAEKEVIELEMDEYCNEDVLRDMGEVEMDTDKLNELVHQKNPHALNFFKLEKATDAEIAEWDADELDEKPLVKDFEENFIPRDPGFIVRFAVEE